MPAPAVLIVEPSADDREVLRTALERRGLRIFEASAAADGAKLAEEHHPAVIVLDLDNQPDDGGRVPAEFAAVHDSAAPSIIILGKACRGHALPPDQVIAKPYRYGPLVHKIEQLAAKAA
jgi:DNA-binding response OmpR family regulator